MVDQQEQVMGYSREEATANGGKHEPKAAQKRIGCFLLLAAAFIIWAAVAYVLWHLAMSQPPREEEEPSAPFELMPRADGS